MPQLSLSLPCLRTSASALRAGAIGVTLALGLLLPVVAAARTSPPPPAPAYERDVLPLFRARCLACHGERQTMAGLDLRRLGDVLEGGVSGRSVVPGSPEGSLLFRMLQDGRMPKGGAKLSPAELKQVERWIRTGAGGATPDRGHWSFQPLQRPPVPQVRTRPEVARSAIRNPVDAFLLAKLQRHGLSFSPEAPRPVLIRRLSYDLLGLPPAPEEVEAFVNDRRPDAYERLVDRLLADPRYGERWARHWLDPAGYADSEGVLQEDRVRPNMWRYRDYVIRSFNQDKPYDRFLREQIAGDELVDYRKAEEFTPELVETLAATGFLRTAVDATRDDFNPHQYGEYQYRMLHDVQTIVFTTALGLTIQCARCHDHKYEPLSQKDYYRVQALFTGAVRPRGSVLPTNRRQIVAATAAEQNAAAETNARVDAALKAVEARRQALLLESRLRALKEGHTAVPEPERAPLAEALALEEAKRAPEQKALVAKHKAAFEQAPDALGGRYPELKSRIAALDGQKADEERKRVVLPEIRAFYDLDASPPPTPLLLRGEWLQPGPPVEPGVPAILDDPRRPFSVPPPPPGAATTGRRRAFAEWLTRPDHPLTARVIVNRVWAHHFGVGLAPSPENLGRSGPPPTHPELLDWLAATFVAPPGPKSKALSPEFPVSRAGDSGPRTLDAGLREAAGLGWSLKRLHRILVTSTAYRQSSKPPASPNPQSAIRNPQSGRRLEAEAVRDGILAAAGTLDPTMYGEPVGLETRPTGEIVPAGEEGRGRRSVYLLVRRTAPVNLLNAFDAPVMETNCPKRVTSTTPTQALAMLNSRFIAAQSRHFARRILKDQPPQGGPAAPADAATVDRAFLLAFSRRPTPAEQRTSLQFLREQHARYLGEKGATPETAVEKAYADFCQALLGANEFAYVD